jgi:hypothetical protein
MTLKLPVHPTYTAAFQDWRECRDAVAGETAIKCKSQIYLPKPTGIEIGNQYEQYERGANWYGASGRAAVGLLGTIIRKPPQVVGVKREELKSLGSFGESLYTLTRDSIFQVLIVGREGIFVDAGEGTSPYIVLYRAEDIVHWDSQYLSEFGKRVATSVMLREIDTHFDLTELEYVETTRYRLLYLDADGLYCQQMFVKLSDSSGPDEQIEPTGDVIRPRMSGGRPLRYIPFYIQGTNSTKLDIEPPPLLDLVKVNISHYRVNADLHWGLHWSALPTPWISGAAETNADGTPTVVPVGSSKAWLIPEAAKCGMLEFTGPGIASIAKELEKKERQMAVLGSRLLEEGKGNTDVAEALKMRLAGDSATLGSIALTASEVWTAVLRTYMDWLKPGYDVNSIQVRVNTDFNMRRMDSQEIIMLTTAFLEGAISFEQLHYNLQRGEIVPEELTAEEHWAQIQARGGKVTPQTITRTPSGQDEDEQDNAA